MTGRVAGRSVSESRETKRYDRVRTLVHVQQNRAE